METLKSFTISVDRRQEHKGTDTEYTDVRVWLRMEGAEDPDACEGLHWLSFLLIGDEWRQLFERGGTFTDGVHKINTFGELWTFYDLPCPTNPCGVMQIEYRHVTVPGPVRKQLTQDIENAILAYDNMAERTTDMGTNLGKQEIKLDYSDRLQEWEKYGQGKGSTWVEATAEVRDRLGSLAGEETFDQCWETLEQLALNTTHSTDDVAAICVQSDGPKGFYWRAGRMVGGLINHGTDDAPNWSVHT